LFARIISAIHIFISYIYFYTGDIGLICLKENAEKFSTFLINTIWIHNEQLNVYKHITTTTEEQIMGDLMNTYKQKQKTKSQVSCVNCTHVNVLEHKASQEFTVYILAGQKKYH